MRFSGESVAPRVLVRSSGPRFVQNPRTRVRVGCGPGGSTPARIPARTQGGQIIDHPIARICSRVGKVVRVACCFRGNRSCSACCGDRLLCIVARTAAFVRALSLPLAIRHKTSNALRGSVCGKLKRASLDHCAVSPATRTASRPDRSPASFSSQDGGPSGFVSQLHSLPQIGVEELPG